MAEQYSGQGTAVAPGVPLCSAPPACRSASLLHDVPAHHTALALVDLVAYAALQAQQVHPSTSSGEQLEPIQTTTSCQPCV